MTIFVNIVEEHVDDEAIKWLHVHVPDYVPKKVGNDEKGKEHRHIRKTRQCKRPRFFLRFSVFHHLLRKRKKKNKKRHKQTHYETATSF